MLTEKQMIEIREHLEKAQNPLFLFDNDLDGLSSFILLKKYIGRGKGVAVRNHPDVGNGYIRKISEFNADYVFVLDRPILGKEFVEGVKDFGIPIVWIDHHQRQENLDDFDYENIFVYNPNDSKNKKSSEPVTYWCYEVTKSKQDIWIAVMGCVADHFLPDFAEEFAERFPDYWSKKKIKEPFDAYYGTEIGFIARALGFGLKDSITHVVRLQNSLAAANSPNDIMLEMEGNSAFGKKYREIRSKYDVLLEKAKKTADKKLIFFSYGGLISISSDISNELSHFYPKHIIVVAYSAGEITNVSMRGKNVRDILEKILPKLNNASGGGHQDAVGVRMQTRDLENFKKLIEKEI